MLVDTHAHICSEVFSSDLPETLKRAKLAGVGAILAVSETLAEAEVTLSECKKHAIIHPAVGLHPEHLTRLSLADFHDELTSTVELLRSTTDVTAIGEVGLDYTPFVLSKSSLETTEDAKTAQKAAFSRFLSLSQELNLPVTAHSRGAGRHALDVVREAATAGPVAIAMHAFDGRPIYAERALQAVPTGLYFSVPPSIVRDDGLKRLVQRLPMERLLLESDSPALGPIARQRNEPANIAATVVVLAGVKGIAESRVRQELWENTESLFPRLTLGGVG